MIVVAAIAAAIGLLFVPVEATYLNRVGSDTIEYRTATCGSPVASTLGSSPGLGGGSAFPIGAESSAAACEGASAKRAVGALALLLFASLGWQLGGRRRSTGQAPERAPDLHV